MSERIFGESGEELKITTASQCKRCKWYDAAHPELARCRVFPDGIPLPILTNKHDHTKPYPGDHGFRFEPKDGP